MDPAADVADLLDREVAERIYTNHRRLDGRRHVLAEDVERALADAAFAARLEGRS